MDSKKLEALKNVHWGPAKSCYTCAFGEFSMGAKWGLCGQADNLYEHNKHQRTHQLPAHFGAVCDKYEEGREVLDIKDFLDSEVTS